MSKDEKPWTVIVSSYDNGFEAFLSGINWLYTLVYQLLVNMYWVICIIETTSLKWLHEYVTFVAT